MTNHENTNPARALIEGISSRMILFLENAEQCLDQLNDQQVWYRENPRDNAIGNLVLHVVGNLRQINNAINGLPDVRDRPSEFSTTGGKSKNELKSTLHNAVTECCQVIDSLPLTRLTEAYRIQNKDTTIAYALIMAMSHFGLHLGQMQFIAKRLLHENYREALRRAPK
jgi:hypothetical protein